MNFHDHISFHAYLPPYVKLTLQYTPQGIHASQHYSVEWQPDYVSREEV